jgi:hypothetical protein
MSHLIYCSCGEVIVKAIGSDTKIRAKILVCKEDAAFAVCKSCDSEVQVPLSLNEDMLKSLSSAASAEKPKHVALYVRTSRTKSS